ncbi:hypothetical protein NX021_06735 [Cytobacillus firmus]|nr:hypothetical protein [Cytobacillus firmus]
MNEVLKKSFWHKAVITARNSLFRQGFLNTVLNIIMKGQTGEFYDDP